jgi:hypothetical protein
MCGKKRDSDVFHRDMLDDEHAANFPLARPWIHESDDFQETYATEDEACAAQRAYRASVGLNPITGE